MFLDNPSQGLLSDAMAEVLRVLDQQPQGRSGRAVAAACHSVSASQANIVLRRLETIGVVRSESVPPAKLYFLNYEHVLSKPLLAIANASLEMFSWLQEMLSGTEGLISAALYELEAAGPAKPEVGLQLRLVLVGEAKAGLFPKLSEVTQVFEARYGNALELVLERLGTDQESGKSGGSREGSGQRLLAEFSI